MPIQVLIDNSVMGVITSPVVIISVVIIGLLIGSLVMTVIYLGAIAIANLMLGSSTVKKKVRDKATGKIVVKQKRIEGIPRPSFGLAFGISCAHGIAQVITTFLMSKFTQFIGQQMILMPGDMTFFLMMVLIWLTVSFCVQSYISMKLLPTTFQRAMLVHASITLFFIIISVAYYTVKYMFLFERLRNPARF